MANTVVGVFEDVGRAEQAVQELINNGFYESNIDLSRSSKGSGTQSNDSDGISRFFSNLFGENDQVKSYSTVAERGAVVTVHAQSRKEAEQAVYILDMYDAVDPNERASEGSYYNSNEQKLSSKDSIPVIEEEMEVGKREIEGDTVRVRSRIFEKPVEENLRLRTEYISVERTPVNRAVTAEDEANFKDMTIEATEHEEIPVVKKEARVVEEVRLKKEVEDREKSIRGSVRKQDVEVDRKTKDREYTSDDEGDLI